MTERYTRRVGCIYRVETIYGTAETSFTANDAILFTEDPSYEILLLSVDRKTVRPWYGNSEKLPAGALSRLRFKTELVGSGVAGTPPAWGGLVRACGFMETISAASRVEYTPVSTGFSGLTFRYNRDGVRYTCKGARGTFKLNLSAYELPIAEFEFLGFETTRIADTMPSIDLSNYQVPQPITTANSGDIRIGGSMALGVISGGTVLESQGIMVDMANKLKHRKFLGGERILLADRQATGEITVAMTPAQEVAWNTEVLAGSITSVGLSHGTTAGRRISIFGARAQRSTLTEVDDEGSLAFKSNLEFLPGPTGQSELTIVAL